MFPSLHSIAFIHARRNEKLFFNVFVNYTLGNFKALARMFLPLLLPRSHHFLLANYFEAATYGAEKVLRFKDGEISLKSLKEVKTEGGSE